MFGSVFLKKNEVKEEEEEEEEDNRGNWKSKFVIVTLICTVLIVLCIILIVIFMLIYKCDVIYEGKTSVATSSPSKSVHVLKTTFAYLAFRKISMKRKNFTRKTNAVRNATESVNFVSTTATPLTVHPDLTTINPDFLHSIPKKLNWKKAETNCKKKGERLYVPSTKAQLNEVVASFGYHHRDEAEKRICKLGYFIGLRVNPKEVWISHKGEYTELSALYPYFDHTKDKYNRHCLVVQKHKYPMRTAYCEKRRCFACTRDCFVSQDICIEILDTVEKISFDEASDLCKLKYKASLLSVRDNQTLKKVLKAMIQDEHAICTEEPHDISVGVDGFFEPTMLDTMDHKIPFKIPEISKTISSITDRCVVLLESGLFLANCASTRCSLCVDS